MKILYFSATGNCLYVAKRIGKELYSIPQLLKDEVFEIEDDVVGIVVPVYGLTLPLIVQRYLSMVNIKADYIFGIMTYGNFDGACTKTLNKVIGNKLDYANTLLMVDNYLPNFKIEDQLEKEPSKNIEQQLTNIIDDINQRKHYKINKNIINRFATYSFEKLTYSNFGNKYLNNSDQKFMVNDKCTSCKICENICPVRNIKVNKLPEFNHKCEFCLGCINACPTNAIHLKKEQSDVRFKNQHVTLNEIIVGNKQ